MSSKYAVGMPTRTESASIPHIPAECEVIGCENDTVVAMASGTKDGRRFVSHGSMFLAPRYSDEGVTYIERHGCTFGHWITRCSKCYEHDVQRAGKAQSQQACA